MVTDGQYTAVLDRVEEDLAILVLEDDEATVGELVVSLSDLPENVQTPDAILDVTVEDGELATAEFRPECTTERAERAQDRFDRLARRPPDEEDLDDS